VRERERKLGLKDKSLLGVAYEYAVPIYTSSPGDSSIGMNVAAKALQGNKLAFDPSLDVNETAAVVLAAKRNGGKKPVAARRNRDNRQFLFSAGFAKEFLLQTEPRFKRCWASTNAGMIFFSRSPTRGPTRADFPEQRRAKPYRGVRLIRSIARCSCLLCRFHGSAPIITAYA